MFVEKQQQQQQKKTTTKKRLVWSYVSCLIIGLNIESKLCPDRKYLWSGKEIFAVALHSSFFFNKMCKNENSNK